MRESAGEAEPIREVPEAAVPFPDAGEEARRHRGPMTRDRGVVWREDLSWEEEAVANRDEAKMQPRAATRAAVRVVDLHPRE
jgi:hypothetical protein